jgi:hypothetical protein
MLDRDEDLGMAPSPGADGITDDARARLVSW